MAVSLKEIAETLGEGWRLEWREPPEGLYLIKEFYMAEPAEVERLCSKEDLVVVYVAAELGHFNVIYGRVKPRFAKCRATTFLRKYPPGRVKEAVRTLVEFATSVDKIPLFQINPDVIRLAGLCGDYPLVCDNPYDLIKRLETPRQKAPVTAAGRSEVQQILSRLRSLLEVNAELLEYVKRLLENPWRLKECYDR